LNIASTKFLETLMTTPSPTGYEEKGRKVWRNSVKKHCNKITGDVHGNSIAVINPSKKPKIMLAGHIDEIAFQVKYIDKKGFIYFNTLGGFDSGIIPGRKVRIHTEKGDICGVVGRKAIHLIEKKDRGKPVEIHELSIDIGAKDKKEAEKIVGIGDPITYDNNFEPLRNDLYVSRGFDDKAGAFVVAEVLRNVYRQKGSFKASLYGVATVQEEVGLRGATTSAFGIDPDVGVAIDVTHASDTPDADVKKSGEIMIGEGAVISRGPNINPVVFNLLVKAAKKIRVKYQIEPSARPTGTDANVIQITRSGVATGLISIPCRYMHTFTEVVSLKDIESAVKILTEFCLSINSRSNFVL